MINYIFLNTFLRSPSFIFLDNQYKRIPYIPPYTIRFSRNKNYPTCIGLSEVFGSFNIRKLSEEYSKYGYSLLVPNSQILVGSGLGFVYSERDIKVLSTHFEEFADSSFPDSMSMKGIFHVYIMDRYTNEKIHCIISHLQCNYSLQKYCSIQKKQLKQIRKYIKKYIGEEKFVLLADLNVEEKEMLKILQIKDNAYPEEGTFHDYVMKPTIFDYILTNNSISSSKIEVLNTMNEKYIHFVDKNVPFISDHFAISRVI